MLKRFLVPLVFLFSVATFAQQGTASPYSVYGIGDVKFKGLTENRLMGGVAVFPDSIHINLQNPAAYSGLKLTTFTVGGSFNSGHYTSYQETEKAQRSTLDYIALAFPAGKKVGFGFGLIPYSSVGYRVRTLDSESTIRKYNGNGGLNKVYLGAGYKINNAFSVGLDLAYNFGNIETTGITYVEDLQFGTQEVNRTNLSGFSATFGTMYKTKINKKYDLFGSLTFMPQTSLTFSNQRFIGLANYSDDYTPSFAQLLDTQTSEVKIKMPSKVTFGGGFGIERKWLVGSEISLTQNSGFGNRFDDIGNVRYEDGFKYSLGGYWIPNYTSFSSYFKKVTYRAGLRYENTGLVVNEQKIRDYAYTAGFGFPLGGTFSNLNLGVEWGRRGTAKALLVEENYLNVLISLSVNDQWFIKRRYD